MKTFISIYLPTWSTDLIQREAEPHKAPLILFAKSGGEKIVARCCEQARSRGVLPGLTLAHAQSLAAGAAVLPYSPAHDIKSLLRLGRWISRYSPLTALDAPVENAELFFDERFCGINSDISGSLRLFKGCKNILRAIVQRLRQRGFVVRAAAAPSLRAAWAFARYSSSPVSMVGSDSLAANLSSLPISALRISSQEELHLRELGIRRIEHLLPIPHHQLLERFGKSICLNLRQALALEPEVISPLKVYIPAAVERTFNGPTCDYRAVHHVIRELLSELLEPLVCKQQFIRSLTLSVSRAGLPPEILRLSLSAPSNCAEHLWSLIRPRIESLQMAEGVTGIALSAPSCEHIEPTLSSLIAGSEQQSLQKRRIDTLIDSLESKLGSQKVLRAQEHASHIPERSFCYYPVKGTPPLITQKISAPFMPPLLLKQPAVLHAISALPDSPPHRFTWNNKIFHLHAAHGPIRINPEWWNDSQHTRDYFRVQTELGTWLWIFRDTTNNRWYLHGIWS